MSRQREAFTLLDVLITLTLMALLLALAMPAVQRARESARRTLCLNNLRNLGIASLSFETANRCLPGPTMNAHPRSGKYSSDEGLFVRLLPFLDQEPLYSLFAREFPSSSSPNKDLLKSRPSILKCPSTQDSMKLDFLSDIFSGPGLERLDGIACDYSGNDGCFVNHKPFFGTVRLRVGGIVAEYKLRDFTDGTSQTFLFWESRGDAIYATTGNVGSANELGRKEFTYFVDLNPSHNLESTTLASYKAYILAWTGFRLGSVQIQNEKTINISNAFGQPYSAHPGVLPCNFVDGSTSLLNTSVDPSVVFALATSQTGDHADVER